MVRARTSSGHNAEQYWFVREPLLVEMPSYIGAHRATIRGASLRRDGAGSSLALVGIFQWRKVGIPSLENSFLLGGVRFPILGRGTTSASFPYHVIGKGKVDLYWSLGGAI